METIEKIALVITTVSLPPSVTKRQSKSIGIIARIYVLSLFFLYFCRISEKVVVQYFCSVVYASDSVGLEQYALQGMTSLYPCQQSNRTLRF